MTIIHAKQALTDDGWRSDVAIRIGADGRIDSLGSAEGAADHALDLVLPAPANLHSHSFQRAMAGLTEARGPDPRDSFWTWRRLMYRFLDHLTPEQVEAIAAQAFVEMAEAGYGAVAEFHYVHHGPGGAPYARLAELSDRIAAAAQQTGLGLTHLPVFYQFGGRDGRALEGGQRRFGNDPDRFARLHAEAAETIAKGPADWTIGLAPHSLRAVDDDGLRQVAGLGGPVHIHIAEQVAEVEEIEAATGARPVDWLLDSQDVGPDWCLIHCTQMTAAETARLAKSGAVAGLCPITEASLGDGIFNGAAFLAAKGRLGVGTDSNIQISLWEELKQLEYSQRLRDRARAVLATEGLSTGRRLFEAAAKGGGQAAQRASGLAKGAWADLIGLSTDNEWIAGRQGDAALDSLIFTGARAPKEVWSAGRHIVRKGRHIAREHITPAYRRAVAALEAAL